MSQGILLGKYETELSEHNISAFFRRNMIGMIIAAMMALLGIVADGVIISRFLGTRCMAAYGLATPMTNLTMTFANVLSSGVQIVCAQLIGAKRNEDARRVFSICMAVTVLLSVILVAAILIWRDEICILLGASGESAELLPLASDYLLGGLFTIPSVILLFEFNGLLRLDNDPNRIIVAVAVMTGLDIFGDLFNVLVIHGGMLGMGLSTSISYAVALLIMLFHFRRPGIIFRFSFKGLRGGDLKDIIVTGSSTAVGSFSAMLRNRVLNGIMLQTAVAVAATAAFSVLNTLLNITSCVMGGMGLTCSMVTGLVIGMNDPKLKKQLVKITVKNALILAVILFAVLFPFAPAIIGLFEGSEGAEMTVLATRGLRIYATGLFCYALNTAYIHYAQGMRRMAVSNTFVFLESFAFVVVPALLLAGSLETDAVWFAFPAAEVLTLLAIVLFRSVRRRRRDVVKTPKMV